MVLTGSRLSIITQILLILIFINFSKSAPSSGLLDQLLSSQLNNNAVVVVVDESGNDNPRQGKKNHNQAVIVESRGHSRAHHRNTGGHRSPGNSLSDRGLINLLSSLANRVVVQDSNDNVNHVIFSRDSNENRNSNRRPSFTLLRSTSYFKDDCDGGCNRKTTTTEKSYFKDDCDGRTTTPAPKDDYVDQCEVSNQSCDDKNC